MNTSEDSELEKESRPNSARYLAFTEVKLQTLPCPDLVQRCDCGRMRSGSQGVIAKRFVDGDVTARRLPVWTESVSGPEVSEARWNRQLPRHCSRASFEV